MKTNYLAFILTVLGLLVFHPSLAQDELKWGIIVGPLLNDPIPYTSYTVSGLVHENNEKPITFFYSLYVKKTITGRWKGETQVGFAKYHYATESYYDDTQRVKFARAQNEFSYLEFSFNNHYIIMAGANEIAAIVGIALNTITGSKFVLAQQLSGQGVTYVTFDMKDEEDDINFSYQLAIQYTHEFHSFKLLLRPFYKRYLKEQFVVPQKKLAAFGLGIGIEF